MFRRCRCVTKPCSLCLAGSLATSCGKHALKKTEASVPFGPFSKGTSNHFTRVSEATLSPSQLDGVLPLRMSRSHAAGAWPARCHTICKASHSLTFSRPALFHGPRCSRKFWAPRVGGRGGSPYIYYVYICVYDVPIKPPSKNSDPPQVSDFPIKRRPRWMTSQATSWISPCRRSRPSHRPLRQCRDLKYLGSG